jgi:hypothetical protein
MLESRTRYWYRAFHRPAITPFAYLVTMSLLLVVNLAMQWGNYELSETIGELRQQLRDAIGINQNLMKHFDMDPKALTKQPEF